MDRWTDRRRTAAWFHSVARNGDPTDRISVEAWSFMEMDSYCAVLVIDCVNRQSFHSAPCAARDIAHGGRVQWAQLIINSTAAEITTSHLQISKTDPPFLHCALLKVAPIVQPQLQGHQPPLPHLPDFHRSIPHLQPTASVFLYPCILFSLFSSPRALFLLLRKLFQRGRVSP